MKYKHWIVTAHAADCEDETYYVIASTPRKAEKIVKDAIRREMTEDGNPPDEVYGTLVVEIPGPPISVHMQTHVVRNPIPIRA